MNKLKNLLTKKLHEIQNQGGKLLVILNELWILSEAGLPVYHQALTNRLDETLFAGFINAILNFIKELGEDEIKKLEMGGSNIVILRSADRKWFFIGRSDTKVKEKKIKKYLSDIREIFYNQFGTILTNWDYSLDIFKELDKSIDINNPESPRTQEYIEKQKSRGAFL